MNTNLPFSQADLETLRAASSQISNAWDKLVEPIKKFGEKYGSAQISESGGFMDRTPDDAPSGNQGFQRSSETKAQRDGSPETGILMKFEDRILSLATLGMKEKRDKLDEKHKRSKEKGTGKTRNASGADGLSGNRQGADSDQLGT